jgi:DNA-binding MarR family transcriptional regulator
MGAPDNWRDEEGLLAWSAFLRSHAKVVAHIERDLREHGGMQLGWYDVLLELNAAPDRRLRMQELGEAAVLSRTRVSRIVDELVAAGLVRREANPDDRRSAFAVITAEGRRELRRVAPVYLDAVRARFVGNMPAKDVPAVRRAFEALLAASEPDEAPRR